VISMTRATTPPTVPPAITPTLGSLDSGCSDGPIGEDDCGMGLVAVLGPSQSTFLKYGPSGEGVAQPCAGVVRVV
jgi:hypothetical protein